MSEERHDPDPLEGPEWIVMGRPGFRVLRGDEVENVVRARADAGLPEWWDDVVMDVDESSWWTVVGWAMVVVCALAVIALAVLLAGGVL